MLVTIGLRSPPRSLGSVAPDRSHVLLRLRYHSLYASYKTSFKVQCGRMFYFLMVTSVLFFFRRFLILDTHPFDKLATHPRLSAHTIFAPSPGPLFPLASTIVPPSTLLLISVPSAFPASSFLFPFHHHGPQWEVSSIGCAGHDFLVPSLRIQLGCEPLLCRRFLLRVEGDGDGRGRGAGAGMCRVRPTALLPPPLPLPSAAPARRPRRRGRGWGGRVEGEGRRRGVGRVRRVRRGHDGVGREGGREETGRW